MADDPETLAAKAEEPRAFRKPAALLYRDGDREQRLVLSHHLVIGSAEGVDCRLVDPLVSRLHAEIVQRDDGVWIRDLGSRNGTFVNDLRVESARVPNRGRIRVGGTPLVVTTDGMAEEPIDRWPEGRYGRLIGPSPQMRSLFAVLHRVAPSMAAVLLGGETGSGKELVAEAIHATSPRVDGPFVTIDCAALPENLLEAELFGHTRGAFTGAVTGRQGAFESAHGGTIFLDEVGELPMSVQPKLLRVLESKTIRRVGENGQRPVDVRVISATHRDLLQMIARGEFREDLYFRLSVLPVGVPPLRERRDDIPALVSHFLAGAPPFSAAVLDQIREWPWAGNVRELRNFVERARALGVDEAIALREGLASATPEAEAEAELAPRAGAVPAALEAGDPLLALDFRGFREAWNDRGEAAYLRDLLARSGGVSAAARTAGLARTYLHRLIRKHGL